MYMYNNVLNSFNHNFWYSLGSNASYFFISSVNLYFLHLSLFILFISLILSLKQCNDGLIIVYLLSFNFTMVPLIDALFRVKNSDSPLISIINRLMWLLSCSNCAISLFLLNSIDIYGLGYYLTVIFYRDSFLYCNNTSKVV